MGTRGKGGKRFLEGSLVKNVMTKCDVPMLFIPEGYSWRKSNEVVYATDFNEFDINTIDRIFKILKPYKPHIHVIHFVEEDDRPKEAVLMNELEQAFLEKDFDGEIHFGFCLSNRNSSDGIFAGGLGFDVVYQGLLVTLILSAALFFGCYGAMLLILKENMTAELLKQILGKFLKKK